MSAHDYQIPDLDLAEQNSTTCFLSLLFSYSFFVVVYGRNQSLTSCSRGLFSSLFFSLYSFQALDDVLMVFPYFIQLQQHTVHGTRRPMGL
jgi:hypothetical protein